MDPIQVIKDRLPELRKQYPIVRVGVFGSIARGEGNSESDIDLLVDFSEPISLFRFSDSKLDLEEILERKVDLVTPGALKPRIKDRILREVVYL